MPESFMLTAPEILRSLPIFTACEYPYSFSSFGRSKKYSGALFGGVFTEVAAGASELLQPVPSIKVEQIIINNEIGLVIQVYKL